MSIIGRGNMKNKIVVIGICFILLSIGFSGCNENDSEIIAEGTYNYVTVAVYATIEITNDEYEKMTPNVTINVNGPKSTNSFQYYPGGGLTFCESIVLHENENIVLTGIHSDELGTFSDGATLTFEHASQKGRRNSYSWKATLRITVPGGTPISAELPLNVTVTADVYVYHLYWNSSKSNYDTVTNIANTIRIDMIPSNGETLTFYRNTVDGYAYVQADFVLEREESIAVEATHQGTGESDLRTFTHDGTNIGYFGPKLNIYIYESQPS